MDLLMILIAVIGITVSIANKKKMAEAKKKRTAFPDKGDPVLGPTRNQSPRSASSKAPASSKSTTLSQKPSAPGTSKWPWPTAAEKAPNKPKQAAASQYGGTPKYTHVVMSTLEGGHTHTESSMTGEEACPPPKPVVQKPAAAAQYPAADAGALLNIQTNSVLQGVLYAEILGKPKALKR